MSPSGRHRTIVIVAVVVVVMVVGSVIYVEYPKKLPPINATDGFTTYTWSGNFSSKTGINYADLNDINATTKMNESGYPDSYLNTSLSGSGGFFSGSNVTMFWLFIYMNGTLAPNLIASSLTFEQNGTVPTEYYGNSIVATFSQRPFAGYNYTGTNGKDVGYYSPPSPPNPEPNMSSLRMSYSWGLTNQSPGNHYPYRFSLATEVSIQVYGVGPNDPFYMNFNVSLPGLSEPVYADTLITVNDTST